MTPLLHASMQVRYQMSAEMARKHFLERPDDIKLNSTFHAMRLKQRELEWNEMRAQSYLTSQNDYGNQFLQITDWPNLLGLHQ